jgi:hypothetical protein
MFFMFGGGGMEPAISTEREVTIADNEEMSYAVETRPDNPFILNPEP